VSLAYDGLLFTGDLMLPPGARAMELEEGDETTRQQSVDQVIAPRARVRDMTICPGHGESFPFSPR
jgi:glyoxylase-like metal-dependent hydrolase (beta-lactamase superfamily II)